jgi:MoxR-like ATPase
VHVSPALHLIPEPALPRPEAAAVARRLVVGVERVVLGRTAAVELVTCAVLAGGHVLVEDVPGSGKTTLARAVAAALGGDLPSHPGHGRPAARRHLRHRRLGARAPRLLLRAGPVFGNVVLVDELNRTPPRTQSAFLEAMDEGAVTVDGQRHALPDPFVVLATQNPLEQYGTYPLPEGQLDRSR